MQKQISHILAKSVSQPNPPLDKTENLITKWPLFKQIKESKDNQY